MENTFYGYSDNPASVDALDLEKYFNGLSSFIQSCPTPMTIAIQGGWGSGKTSAMNIIEDQLKNNESLVQIKFNTWQYSRVAGDNLFLPLLNRMMNSIGDSIEKIAKKQKKENDDFVKALPNKRKSFRSILGGLKYVGKSVLGNYSDTAGFIMDLIDRLSTGEKKQDFSEESGAIYDYIEQLKSHLDEEINYLENDLKVNRIVFYIDDLDRLEPEVAVGFLEDLRNFVICKNCVFVLALDHEIVWRGISRKYHFDVKDDKDAAVVKEYSSRFFDKLIQMPFSLPCHQYNVEKYIDSLLDTSYDRREFARIIRMFGDTNPRTIKRVLNIFQMYKHIEDQSYEGHDRELLTLLLLQMNHEELYKSLVAAVSCDASVSNNPLLRTFHDSDVNCQNVENWFKEERDDKNSRIAEGLKEVFALDNSNDNVNLLFDIIGATSITGDGLYNEHQQVEETKKLIEDYLVYLGFTRLTENEDKYAAATDSNVRIEVKLPGNSADHVNLNITSPNELQHNFSEDRRRFFTANFIGNESFDIQTPDNKLHNNPGMDILYNSNEPCCVLRNVSVSESASMQFAGRILKNISKTGKMFP